MADSDLAARLAAHEHAFQGLLDLIPAKFYNPEDAANQWNKRKQTKEEAAQAKRAKLDPDQALRRHNKETPPVEPQHNDRAKTRKEKKVQMKSPKSVNQPKQNTKLKDRVLKAQTNGENKTNGNGDNEAHANGGEAISESVTATPSTDTNDASTIPRPDPGRNIADIRAKLAAKIEALRSKRKAPGTGVDGAPSSRTAILEARRKKQESRKEKKRLEKEARKDAAQEIAQDEDDASLPDDEDIEEDDDSDDEAENGISYGKVAFADGQQVGVDGSIKTSRKRKQQDTKSALQAAMNKKARIDTLPEDKRAKIADSDSWHRALLQADGEKVKDDLTLLKKAAKRKEGIKKKSEKEWKERLATIAKAKALKQKNREQNLKDRRDSKGKAGGHKKGKQIGAYQGKKKANGKSGKGGF